MPLSSYPAGSAEWIISPFFLCQRCRECLAWNFGEIFRLCHIFQGLGAREKISPKLHAKNRCEKRKISCKIHSAGCGTDKCRLADAVLVLRSESWKNVQKGGSVRNIDPKSLGPAFSLCPPCGNRCHFSESAIFLRSFRERKMRTKFFCTNFLNTARGPGHPGKIPGTSRIPLFETQGRQSFEGGHEVFGHHPFAWKTPTPPGGLRTQKLNLCALFSWFLRAGVRPFSP